MFLYFIAIVVIFLVWQAKDFVGHDILKDFSNTSVPLLKNSINFIFSTPGLIDRVQSTRIWIIVIFWINRRNFCVSSQLREKVWEILSAHVFCFHEFRNLSSTRSGESVGHNKAHRQEQYLWHFKPIFEDWVADKQGRKMAPTQTNVDTGFSLRYLEGVFRCFQGGKWKACRKASRKSRESCGHNSNLIAIYSQHNLR